MEFQDEYEDLYILTVEEVFQAACTAVRKEQSEELLIKFYLELFEQKEMLLNQTRISGAMCGRWCFILPAQLRSQRRRAFQKGNRLERARLQNCGFR